MNYLKIIMLISLFISFEANAEREDNCDIIGDLAFITMVQRQSGISKDEVTKNFPFEKLTINEKKTAKNLIETVYKVPVRDEFNCYESLEKFSSQEKEHCIKLVKEKI